MDLLIIILVLLVGVVLFGALFEFFSALRDRQLYRTPPGKLVDAGDVLLHFVVMGDAHPGKPTVILDAGVGGNHLDWQLTAAGYCFVRYADDFVVACDSKAQAQEALTLVERVVEGELGLALNRDKVVSNEP